MFAPFVKWNQYSCFWPYNASSYCHFLLIGYFGLLQPDCAMKCFCTYVSVCCVCLVLISTASTFMHVSCLTFGLPLNSLSLTTRRHGCPFLGGLITCHSSTVTSSQIQGDPGHPLCLRWPFPLWTRLRPFEGCPCLIPSPHSASTVCVYQPLQVQLEETLHGGEINRQEKINVSCVNGPSCSKKHVYLAQCLKYCVLFSVAAVLIFWYGYRYHHVFQYFSN